MKLFSKKNRTLLIIALIAMVNMLGYGIIIPILYSYSVKFGLSDFENGLLFAMFSICQFAATPVIGRLSDKYGRRPLLIISITGTALSMFVMAFAPNALFLFLARALDGITAGNIPVAFAVISDSTKPEERPHAFGIVGAAFSFGFIFGPAIAAFTIGFGAAMPFIIAGVITFIAVILTALFLPETNKHMAEDRHGKLFDFPLMAKTLLDKNVGPTFLISLIFFLAFACSIIYGFQPYVLNVLKLTVSENAMLFTLFGIVGFITQMFLVQRFSKWFGLRRAFMLSIFFTGIALLMLPFSTIISLFIIVMIILGVANGVVQTLIPAILSRETDAKSQGSVMGLNASYQSLGMIFGPIIGGMLSGLFIPLPFVVGGLLMFVCFLLSFKVMRPGMKPVSEF